MKEKVARIRWHGFTLVELLVVISIIAVLLAVLMPALSKARENGKRVVCGNNQKQLGLSIITFAQENGDFVPPCEVGSQYMPYLLHTIEFGGRFYNLGDLYRTKFLQEPKIFYCPSATVTDLQFNTLKNPWWERWDPAKIAQGVRNNTMSYYTRSSYYYFTREKDVFWNLDWLQANDGKIKKKLILLKNKAILCDNMYDPTIYSHKGKGGFGGLNVLYANGSVKFWRDSSKFLYERSKQKNYTLSGSDVYAIFDLFDQSQ